MSLGETSVTVLACEYFSDFTGERGLQVVDRARSRHPGHARDPAGDPRRLDDARCLPKLAGSNPTERSSGKTQAPGGIHRL